MPDDKVIHVQPLGSPPNTNVWLPGRCPKSGKRMFPRKRHAEATLAEWRRQNDWDGYVYWCTGPANGGDGCGH